MEPTINDAWKATSKILLGEEIGEMGDYKEYLMKYVNPKKRGKSDISGKETITTEEILNGTKIMSNDEIGIYHKKTDDIKLGINDIKDIDSIVEALKEKFYYTGNIVLGNSNNIEKTTRCKSSSFV